MSDAAAEAAPDGSVVDPDAGPIPGCPKCKPIFDGTTLNGWDQGPPGSFVIKNGTIASTGKDGYAWTKEDYGDFRIFLSVRQIVDDDHKPCTTLFTQRPMGQNPDRGLRGIQFQPPRGSGWDYRPGKNNDPARTNPPLMTHPEPRLVPDTKKWHRCEILARASTGEFRAACCQIEGLTTCKAQEVTRFKDPTAGRKGPFALMMHNPGLFDEFKDIYVETDPVGDELISTK